MSRDDLDAMRGIVWWCAASLVAWCIGAALLIGALS